MSGLLRAVIIVGFSLSILTACFGTPERKVVKNTDYQIGIPTEPWRLLGSALTFFDADHAFIQRETASAFYLRSECDLYRDAGLKQLSGGLTRLFENVEIESQHLITLAKRNAFSTVFAGELDGVKVKVRTVILKKHSCNFDFVFVSLPENYNKDHPAYEKFIQEFTL